MMLHRSASSRRRRASRNVANSPHQPLQSSTSLQQQSQQQQQQQQLTRGRRASVASTKPSSEVPTSLVLDRQRSPRASCVPNISLEPEDETPEEVCMFFISCLFHFFFFFNEQYLSVSLSFISYELLHWKTFFFNIS